MMKKPLKKREKRIKLNLQPTVPNARTCPQCQNQTLYTEGILRSTKSVDGKKEITEYIPVSCQGSYTKLSPFGKKGRCGYSEKQEERIIKEEE